MGKSVTAQLPVPHDTTVALLKKGGGKEGAWPDGVPARSSVTQLRSGSRLTSCQPFAHGTMGVGTRQCMGLGVIWTVSLSARTMTKISVHAGGVFAIAVAFPRDPARRSGARPSVAVDADDIGGSSPAPVDRKRASG
jgi:hypothetical protein